MVLLDQAVGISHSRFQRHKSVRGGTRRKRYKNRRSSLSDKKNVKCGRNSENTFDSDEDSESDIEGIVGVFPSFSLFYFC